MHCGFDFGTSNSAIVTAGPSGLRPIALENGQLALPSASFYRLSSLEPQVGRAAIHAYVDGEEGRLMRSMKSVLGTSLMEESTQIGRHAVLLTEVVGQFIRVVKGRAEAELGASLAEVVQGRPVHFVDGDEAADRKAEAALERELRSAGFSEVVFEYEPVAAARHFEKLAKCETLALICDIGGGTSDFSLVRIAPGRGTQVLANHGVRIGGTDFDQKLSLVSVMPLLGHGAKLTGSGLVAPTWMYVDLSTPSRIARLYDRRQYLDIIGITESSRRDERFARLRTVMRERSGHRISTAVEAGKIALSTVPEAIMELDFIADGLSATASAANLAEAVEQPLAALGDALEECTRRANVAPTDVPLAVMTGGSTEMPLVQAEIAKRLPRAELQSCDRFGAVAAGLAQRAFELFG